ncbi:MAG: fibronectin type III domain-containing protein [Clostridia bacterium]|nr:fibronectin type III domain-containing protein [Clostridia bacterium]MDY5556083.1 fibronectin type III domain-containing protein [Blautia sp.]
MKKEKYLKRLKPLWMFLIILTAVLGIGHESVKVFASTGTTNVIPGKVSVTKVSALAYNQVQIKWKKTDNATHYYIYYKKSKDSKWTKLASVKSNVSNYTHKSSSKYPIVVGQPYSYTVRAYNSTSGKYGAYNKKGLTVKTLPSTVKLLKAEVRSDKISVNLTWERAYGCDYYEIYRRTAKSSWKMIGRVKSNVLQYTDTAPQRGWRNIYTVRAYNSKTGVYGNYDKTGVFAAIFSVTFDFPTIQEAYRDVLRGINAGDMDHIFMEPENGVSNCEYFLYDMNNDEIPEMIVGSDCQWDEEDRSYIRKICHVYTCIKTEKGYQAKQLNCYIWDPQMSADHDCLYGNYYWYSQSANIKYKYFIEDNIVYCYGCPEEYKIGDKALEDFDAKNPKPVWTKISDYGPLLRM